MSDSNDFRKSLKDIAADSAAHTDQLLDEELQTLLKATIEDLEALRPHVTDQETYNKLISVVEEATQYNEKMARLKEMILKGGSKLLNLSKKASKMLAGI